MLQPVVFKRKYIRSLFKTTRDIVCDLGKISRNSTVAVIYSSVILPKVLFSCTFWYDYTNSDILMCDRTHRDRLKHLQQVCKWMSTALCWLDIIHIATIIAYRKLLFLGQLCRLELRFLAKVAFVLRWVSFYNGNR